MAAAAVVISTTVSVGGVAAMLGKAARKSHEKNSNHNEPDFHPRREHHGKQ